MKAPESLETLIDYGIIQDVVRPLMSGKEAQVYVVVSGGEECVAKVYKEATQRTFKHRSDYTEGRRTRNTRDQRALAKRTQHGRRKDEEAWRSTEVEMIYRLRDVGVRVPEPINFVEGVLVMELVKDAQGNAAPRLGDLTFSPAEAREIYHQLIREVVRMLCAGVVHGDLSDFNVLMGDEGPVVIDFPQAVDPTHNPNSKKLLLRDVENLHRFLVRFAPAESVRPYGEEIWSLFQANRLVPDTQLGGHYQAPAGKADTKEVMALIEDASREERKRRSGGGRAGDEEGDERDASIAQAPAPLRKVVDFSRGSERRSSVRKSGGATRGARPTRRRATSPDQPVPPAGPASSSVSGSGASPAPAGRRRRRANKNISEPARKTREAAPRSDASTDDAKDEAAPRRRRRTRRGRPRTQSNDRSSSESAPANSNTGGNTAGNAGGNTGGNARGATARRGRGRAGTGSRAKRPAQPASSSPSSDSSRAGDGPPRSGHPPRRRRRRPREANAPE